MNHGLELDLRLENLVITSKGLNTVNKRLCYLEVLVASLSHLQVVEKVSVNQGHRSLWDRGTCPPIFMKGGTSMLMSPNILEVMMFRMATQMTTRNYVQIPKESG